MKKRIHQLTTAIMMFVILGISAFNTSGCGNKVHFNEDMGSANASFQDTYDEYKSKFQKIRGVEENETKEESNDIEEWKRNYLLLMTEFMAGGFTTTQNLDFLNKNYPAEYYRFCLEDLNNDSIPELLLGYGYNGSKPEYWEIFKSGIDYDSAYVGTARMYDRENGLLLNGYPPSDLSAFRFDGNKLSREYEYYVEWYEYTDEDENISDTEYRSRSTYYFKDNAYHVKELSEIEYIETLSMYTNTTQYTFTGKRLNPENLAKELGVSIDACIKECANKAYLGRLHYLIGNELNNEKDLRYALLMIDDDSVPELVAFGGNIINIWFYRNGRLNSWRLDASDKKDVFHFLYYPRQNIVSMECAYLGDEHDNYITIRNEMVESLLSRILIVNFSRTYYVDDRIVDKNVYDSSKQALFDVYELDEAVRFEDTEHLSFEGIIAFLEEN